MTIVISTSCTGCGSCLCTCPTRALVAAVGRPHLRAEACTGCLACLEVCPADSITAVAS